MIHGIIIVGIIIACLLAAAALVQIFFAPMRPFEEELRAFTVLVYRHDDEYFEKNLLDILSQLRWTEPCFYSEIYVVHMNVPEMQSASVREICSSRRNLIYISIDEFITIMHGDKKSLERDCNLSKKVV